MIGSLFRPMRRWLAQRGLRTMMLKNPGQGGFAGIALNWREADPAHLLRGAVATVREGEHVGHFLIADEDDLIQRELANGRFYEPEELAIIARHFIGGTFVDIGANLGNHAVYAGVVLGASRIVAVEPNPDMARLLRHNLALNHLSSRAQVHEVGLSDEEGRATLERIAPHNISAARLETGEGAIKLAAGDDILARETPSFIKIDTEGFEAKVLQGLARTLAAHRPAIFIEVEDANRSAVEALLTPLGYAEVERFSRYPGLANYLYKVDGAASAATPHNTQENG
jgi:FkbM family methyltransferase